MTTEFFEPILEPETSLQQKQQIADECEEHVSTNCLGCAAYLVCGHHMEAWRD
ncbi:conserved hypothetical protein [Vibrio crassostreae]|nr:conserved hypothetical protein [Vibrio crassostreae]CAK2283803.1 conserved hypothetical protein [Vibrio crassostreae]CAK2295721.1 conserved hypothetical protein [Vibrio crassostreae]CAK2447269.1 conserved hypothetical protein [Vibrio crassostreae]CAK2691460.1 conserved hypothetical protein [Vibrio crassostreae]